MEEQILRILKENGLLRFVATKNVYAAIEEIAELMTEFIDWKERNVEFDSWDGLYRVDGKKLTFDECFNRWYNHVKQK